MGTLVGRVCSSFDQGRLGSVLERTRTGLREMPSNAVWLMSRFVKPAGAIGGAGAGAGEIEIRAERARDAAERAREAEGRAVEAARESKAAAKRARALSEQGRAQVRGVERETDRQVKQRVREAQKAAEELVRRE